MNHQNSTVKGVGQSGAQGKAGEQVKENDSLIAENWEEAPDRIYQIK